MIYTPFTNLNNKSVAVNDASSVSKTKDCIMVNVSTITRLSHYIASLEYMTNRTVKLRTWAKKQSAYKRWKYGVVSMYMYNQYIMPVSTPFFTHTQIHLIWNAISCLATVTECPDPASVTNGIYSPSFGPYVHNTTLTYSCDPGYLLLAGEAQHYCDNGAWIGVTPVCLCKIFCQGFRLISWCIQLFPIGSLNRSPNQKTCLIQYLNIFLSNHNA